MRRSKRIKIKQFGKEIAVTPEQLLFQKHLRELGIETWFEFRFCLWRKFHFDLYCERLRMGFEVNGTYQGLHGRRWDFSDLEKLNIAQLCGYRCMQFTNQQVRSGEAKKFLADWMGK